MRRGICFFGILLMITLLVVPLGCGDEVQPEPVDEPNAAEDVQEPSTDSAEESREPDQDKEFSIGDSLRMEDVVVTLNGVRLSEGGDFFKPEDGHVFFLADFSVNNNSDESINVSSMMQFDLVDGDGYSQDMSIYVDAKGDMDGQIGAGRTKSGEIAWEVPRDARGLELVFEPDFLRLGQAIWIVGDVADLDENASGAVDEGDHLSEDAYVEFFIDHLTRLFQIAEELEGDEELRALESIAEEYFAFTRGRELPPHLERVHDRYSRAMEIYAGIEDADEADGWVAINEISAATEELESAVDMSIYE